MTSPSDPRSGSQPSPIPNESAHELDQFEFDRIARVGFEEWIEKRLANHRSEWARISALPDGVRLGCPIECGVPPRPGCPECDGAGWVTKQQALLFHEQECEILCK